MPKKFVKLGTLIPFDGNSWKIEFVSKHQRQKLEWASQSFGRASWTWNDFAINLNLVTIDLDLCKDIINKVISQDELVFAFGERNQNGWKVKENEELFTREFASLQKLYEDVYAHSPPNDDYVEVFLKGWPWKQKGEVVN